MSILSRLRVLTSNTLNRMIFLKNNVQCGENLRSNGTMFIKNQGKICIGNNFTVNSSSKANPIGCGDKCYFQVMKGGEIQIGNNVGISSVSITSRERVTIEDDVLLGAGVKIYDTDFHRLGGNTEIGTKQIIIKKGAFIGANSIVLKGVTIGENSIVGAGSVVTRSIPDFEVWGGNPVIYLKTIQKAEGKE